MKQKPLINGYFQFTRKDRIATLIIGLILLIAFLLPQFLRESVVTAIPASDTAWMNALRQLEKSKSASTANGGKREPKMNDDEYVYDRTADSYNNGEGKELFSFDPNTLDPKGWQKLGIRPKTIGTIQKYLAKGGRFRKPEDLQRVYGLRAAEYERLHSYIRIESPSPSPVPANEPALQKPARRPMKEVQPVDINTADSTAFEALPGIGAKLAMRIIHFREKLGGFYSVEQVRETFGLADSIFIKIKPYLQTGTGLIHKININKAGLDELKAHPYIRYNLARIILNYRQQHGPFANLEDLKKISMMETGQYEKIKVYLTTE